MNKLSNIVLPLWIIILELVILLLKKVTVEDIFIKWKQLLCSFVKN
jgi:hypothetical protein